MRNVYSFPMKHEFMKKVCCLLMVCLSALSALGQGSDRYRTTKQQEMANLLPIDLSNINSSGYNFDIWKGYSIAIRNNHKHQIEHIGLKLFNRQDLNDRDLSIIFDFVERYLLELILIGDRQQIASVIKSDNVTLEYGDFSDLKKITDALLLNIHQDETNQYKISWTDNQTKNIIYSFSFPMHYELILGMNKKEIEEKLVEDILSLHSNIEVREEVRKENLKQIGNAKYYVKEGRKYIIESLNSNLYYIKQKNEHYSLIRDFKYPVESLANLMLSEEGDTSYQLDITQNKYGYQTSHYTVPLKQWIRYCLYMGCTPYFGLESEDDKEIRASVVMENRKLAYNHILYITFSKDQLKRKDGVIKTKLHAYIPTHNVIELFDETKSKSGNKYKITTK